MKKPFPVTTPSGRIAFNASATYLRTIFTAVLALYSSRWVLNALGQTDYGLFCVVGSVIVFITFLNSVMSSSAARYFAYSIGQGDPGEVNRWFNAALSIHLCLALVLILIGWPVGGYLIGELLTVPDARVEACLGVFHLSLLASFVGMISVPFVAMFTAKQQITELAGWGILQSTLTFALAWGIGHASGDRLLRYAAGMVAIMILVQLAQMVRALALFEECRVLCRQWFERRRFREIFSFAACNLIGSAGALFRDQGSAILLNLFFGPGVNAAYGIATQVSAQTNQLSAAMVGAFTPEITACEGRGDRTRMLLLSQCASKFGTILVLLLAVPLLVEMEYILKLWLRQPPAYTALFCQLILCSFLIDRLSTGYMLAINAHGKIAAYQATLGTCLVLTLPLAWLFLELGLAPTSIGIAFIITMSVTSLGRVLWGRHLLGIALRSWWTGVVRPSALVACATAAAAFLARWSLSPSFLRFMLVSTASLAVSLLVAWFFAMTAGEREALIQNLRRLLRKFGLGRGLSELPCSDLPAEKKGL